MRIPVRSLLVSAGVLLSASVCWALAAGPDLTGSWRSVQMAGRAPKPDQSTLLDGMFVIRNEGNRLAPASRATVYLHADRVGFNARNPRLSRFIKTVDVPVLVPGQQWNGRVTCGLEPGLDVAGLRLTVVLDADGDTKRSNDQLTSDVIPAYRDK